MIIFKGLALGVPIWSNIHIFGVKERAEFEDDESSIIEKWAGVNGTNITQGTGWLKIIFQKKIRVKVA